jgi:hypothetical protein
MMPPVSQQTLIEIIDEPINITKKKNCPVHNAKSRRN